MLSHNHFIIKIYFCMDILCTHLWLLHHSITFMVHMYIIFVKHKALCAGVISVCIYIFSFA